MGKQRLPLLELLMEPKIAMEPTEPCPVGACSKTYITEKRRRKYDKENTN